MSRIAVYPGSFDPITVGHIDIIQRISKVFDRTTILVSQSSLKAALFTAEERRDLIKACLGPLKNVDVDVFDGLTVDYVRKHKAHVIVRGLRAVVDFEYEMTMASINQKIAPEIETMLVFARPEYYYVSSRGVKELAMNGAPLKDLVPDAVVTPLLKKLGRA